MENRTRHGDRKKRTFWIRQADNWKVSGLSQAEFARRQGLRVNTFRWWLHRLEQTPMPFVEIKTDGSQVEPPPDEQMDSGVCLEIGLVSVRLARGFDDEVLLRVLALVRRNRACS